MPQFPFQNPSTSQPERTSLTGNDEVVVETGFQPMPQQQREALSPDLRIDGPQSIKPPVLTELPESCASQNDPPADASSDQVELTQDQPQQAPELSDSPSKAKSNHSAQQSRRIQQASRGALIESLRQAMIMVVTVAVLLVAAKFALPGIVESVTHAFRRGQLRAQHEVASASLRDVSLDSLSHAYQMVSDVAGPSVVHIDVQRQDVGKLTQLSRNSSGAPSILISDQGSGVVVDTDGYLLTNRHVVMGSEVIEVTLSDGRRRNADVIGTDPGTDLALLKVDADHLIPIRWGDSEAVGIGSPVWAIGSPFGLNSTVTFGVLSGKHRVVRADDQYQDFMQSDVAVNPGNSGGPLVDAAGSLIGINTAIIGDTYQGVSFAIPSEIAHRVYDQLRAKGKVLRGHLGVTLLEVPDQQLTSKSHLLRGALVGSVVGTDSPAALAGLQVDDIITHVDGEAIRSVVHLIQVVGNAMAGTKIEVSIVRSGQSMNFSVSLGTRPPALDFR